jgi:DNA-directed RNA polymerase specialized sigma24 family protein
MGTRELRTEQRHTKNNYPNDDLAAFALPVGKCKSKVCSLVCSELRKFRDFEDTVQEILIKAYQKLRTLERWSKFLTWACTTISNLCKNCDLLQSRHHYSEFAEAHTPRGWQGHLLLRKAIANGVQKMEVR